MEIWRDFLREVHPGQGKGMPAKYNYGQLFQSKLGTEPIALVDVDIEDMDDFNPVLASAFELNALDCRVALTILLQKELQYTGVLPGSKVWPNFIGKDPEDTLTLEELRDHHIGYLVSFKVDVIRIEPSVPHYDKKFFRCQWDDCGHTSTLRVGLFDQDREPRKCQMDNCRNARSFELLRAHSTHYTVQWISVQTHREHLNVGVVDPTPAVLTHGMAGVSNVRGVTIHAVYRFEVLPRPKGGGPSKVYHYLEVFGIEHNDAEETLELTDEDRAYNEQLAKRPDIHTYLARSFVPGILGNLWPKMAIVLQAVGAVKIERAGGGRFRALIHILMMGDTSTAKSDLIEGGVRINVKSVYSSGEGASGVGLSAAALKDKTTGRYYAQPGLLVLGNGGLAALDEVGELTNEDLNKAKSGLERGTILLTKGGLHLELVCETSFLGGGNPPHGQRLKETSIIDQITLDHAFLSRMDLIFGIRDIRQEERDRKIADAMLKGLMGKIVDQVEGDEDEALLTEEQLLKFIIHCHEIFPVFPETLIEKVQDIYVLARNSSAYGHLMTARQMWTIVRLALAAARCRFANVVSEGDIELARDILAIAMESLAALDMQPDLDHFDRKVPMVDEILQAIRNIDLANGGTGADEYELIKDLQERGIEEKKAYGFLKLLRSEQKIRIEERRWFLC